MLDKPIGKQGNTTIQEPVETSQPQIANYDAQISDIGNMADKAMKISNEVKVTADNAFTLARGITDKLSRVLAWIESHDNQPKPEQKNGHKEQIRYRYIANGELFERIFEVDCRMIDANQVRKATRDDMAVYPNITS